MIKVGIFGFRFWGLNPFWNFAINPGSSVQQGPRILRPRERVQTAFSVSLSRVDNTPATSAQHGALL
jgi:hypothetical protein